MRSGRSEAFRGRKSRPREAREVIQGKVVWHSSDRDEVYQKAIDWWTKSAAALFTGRWPENKAAAGQRQCRPRFQRVEELGARAGNKRPEEEQYVRRSG